MAEDSNPTDITRMLLQDAQQEISNLRADIFRTRQLSEERRQAVEGLQAENAHLKGSLASVQAQLGDAHAQCSQLSAVQHEAQQLAQRITQLQAELQAAKAHAADTERQLQAEAKARQAAEQAKSKLEFDRSRLQKARDDLAAQVRLAQQKARDAEEEQCRAEDDAAALRAELHNLQASLAHAAPHHEHGNGNGMANGQLAMLQVDLAAQLEAERQRTTTLYTTLTGAKAELQRRTAQLEEAQQQLASRDAAALEAEEQLQQAQARLRGAEEELASCVSRMNALQAQLAASPHPHTPHRHPQQQHTANGEGPGQTGGAGGNGNGLLSREGSSSQLLLGTPESSVRHQRPPSLGGMSGSQSGQDLEGLGQHAERAAMLAKRVAAMKVARDKLLVQLDQQMMEADRLAVENRALGAEVLQLREHCAAWESQAQAAIAQMDRLKDIIEESASWGPASEAQSPHANGDAGNGNGASASGKPSPDVLQQVARCTELDIQVRALCAELARARGGQAAMGRSLLPVLQGVELRLAQLKAGGAAPEPVR